VVGGVRSLVNLSMEPVLRTCIKSALADVLRCGAGMSGPIIAEAACHYGPQSGDAGGA
jgi:hypothetical protein